LRFDCFAISVSSEVVARKFPFKRCVISQFFIRCQQFTADLIPFTVKPCSARSPDIVQVPRQNILILVKG